MGTPDALTWNFEENGEYSTSSAYHAQFVGATPNNFESIIWKTMDAIISAGNHARFFS
jgi:hypothetical protein